MSEAENFVYSVEQVRLTETNFLLDRPGSESLMKKAGRAALRWIRQCWPNARTITIFCGSGNNGGDGYALAEELLRADYRVRVIAVSPPKTAEAQAHYQAYLSRSGEVSADMNAVLEDSDLLVDALLGIGFREELRKPYDNAIEVLNRSSVPVLALDTPSGICADTGKVGAVAVRAQVTLSFLGLKRGLVTGPALDYVGQVLTDDLDTDPQSPWGEMITPAMVRQLQTDRPPSFHKGQAGHVGIVGGGEGMAGAAALCAEATLRSGAGKVSVACHESAQQAVASHCPEIMVDVITDPGDLDRFLGRIDVLVVGPGMGQSAWSKMVFARCLESTLPKVIDADGLNLLAMGMDRPHDAVLTPHPGEAARLLGVGCGEIEADRPAAVGELVSRYQSTTILKGAGTLIGGLALATRVCDRGNPGMASPGMGDTLTGVVAGLRGQGWSAFDSSTLAVWCHATAGDLAARDVGSVGLVASDVIQRLATVRKNLD